MRNPERLKDFLIVLSKYDGQLLTINIIEKVAKELIQKGLYQPTRVSLNIKNKWKQNEDLTDNETDIVFNDNPQLHKEAGFDKGWASRFDTWYKLAKELGFVYYWQNKIIEFSDSAKLLIDKDKPENEQIVYANAFSKYIRNNPFRRVLNNNTPLILLLQVIQLLNKDKQIGGKGISRKEIPILLCWQNNDAHLLYKVIKKLRKDFNYSPSSETILEICYNLIDDTKRNDNSILFDYPDEFIRKMRLTGLITLRGGGRFIDVNNKEFEAIKYILNNYSNQIEFTTESEFYNHISTIDYNLVSKLSVSIAPIRASDKELDSWVSYYQWDKIKKEMLNLSNNISSSDNILKIIERPLRLEFLTALAIRCKLPEVIIKPNFLTDDEGLPTSFASGGIPDIECYESKDTILVEVTLLTGTQQHIRESYSIQRHLEEFKISNENSYSIFISPKCFIDTCRNAKYIKYQYDLDVKILDIQLFIDQLENCDTIRKVAFSKTSCN